MKKIVIIFLIYLSISLPLNAQWYIQYSYQFPIEIYQCHFTDNNRGWAVGERVFFTLDGGTNWYPTTSFWWPAFSVYFVDNQIGLMGRNSGLYKTDNGGGNWLEVLTLPMEFQFYSIYFDSSNGIVIGCKKNFNEGNFIFKSSNFGSTWTEILSPTDYDLNSICFRNKFDGFIVGNNGLILKTTDGGNNWTETYLGSNNLKSIFFSSELIGWIGCTGGMYKTTDGGINWNFATIYNGEFCSIFFTSDSIGFTCEGSNLLKSINGGENWEIIDTNDVSYIYFVDDSVGWAVTRTGKILHTTNSVGHGYSGFDYPLEIGNTWTYKYDYDYSHMGDWSKRHGNHIWTVIDSSTLIDDFTRFTIASENIDTVSSSYNPTPTLKIDTTYFYVDRGQNTIIVRPPSNVYPIVDNITGYFSGNDTLRIGGRVYVERFGLISLFDSNGTNTYYKQVQKLLEFNGNPVSVQEESLLSIPSGFSLSQNYPNPFNPSTKISWQTLVSGWQTLKVYDVLGNEVATLVNEYRPAGSYEIEFKFSAGSRQLANGVYFYRLQAGDYAETKKMILLK